MAEGRDHDKGTASNLKARDEKVLKSVERILNLQKRRKNINDDIANEKSNMELLGVDKKALMQRIAMMKMDKDQREEFDTSIAYLAHLFEGEMTLFTPDPSDTNPRSDPKRGGAGKGKKAASGAKPTEAELSAAAAAAPGAHDDEQAAGGKILDDAIASMKAE